MSDLALLTFFWCPKVQAKACLLMANLAKADNSIGEAKEVWQSVMCYRDNMTFFIFDTNPAHARGLQPWRKLIGFAGREN